MTELTISEVLGGSCTAFHSSLHTVTRLQPAIREEIQGYNSSDVYVITLCFARTLDPWGRGPMLVQLWLMKTEAFAGETGRQKTTHAPVRRHE